MLKKLPLVAVFAVLASTATVAKAQDEPAEGHPFWWWDFKKAEMIVSAQVDYGSSPYYTISWPDKDGTQRTSYYILGKLKIKDYLYVGSHSRYLDNYKYLLREKPKEVPVLIAAERVFFSGGDQNQLIVQPSTVQIGPSGTTLTISLTQNYLFPIHDLFLETVIPNDSEKDAKNLIREKKDNLVLADAPQPTSKAK